MSCLYFRGMFLTLCLAQTTLSRLHPECEYIFQLEKEERRCLQHIAELGNRSTEGCWPFWDAVACWPQAVTGETVQRGCPAVFSLFRNNTGVYSAWGTSCRNFIIFLLDCFKMAAIHGGLGLQSVVSNSIFDFFFLPTTGSVSRNCTSRGWSKPFPPYHVACSVDDDIPETEESYFATVKLIYTIGYSISLGVLAVAVFILLLFRRLRCARNFIHIQLFLTFILKSVAVFIKDATLFSSDDTNHCTLSTFSCKASVVFCHYCVMANFLWLLVEALYLNSLLLSSFYHSRRCLWGFGLLGWGVPVFFIVLWIGSRVYFEDTECWDINEDSPYWWIIKGPIIVSIAVNFMLFVNIIRILIQKLNPRLIQFNNSSQYRRLAKSTLLLIPLFGTHYMFFNFLPDYFNINLRLCIELCMGSFQGLLVAILYCFLNQEVQKEVQMQWLRWQERSYGVVSPAAKGSQMDTPF